MTKTNPARALMAVANIFTLLELKESASDKREWEFYKRVIPKLRALSYTLPLI